ncbi:MAG: IS200/IS605 family transposase [Patescibacteria group bacterium]
MKFKTQAHCIYRCDFHIILTAKYRRKIFNAGVFAYLKASLQRTQAHYSELEIKTINHDTDHIHILISIPPKWSVAQIVRVIKLNTAGSLKKKFPHIQKAYWGVGGIWSDGYFVSTVGVTEKIIHAYIQQQGKQDFGQAQLDLG